MTILKFQRFGTRFCVGTAGSAGVEYALLLALIVVGLVYVSWETTGRYDGIFHPVAQALTQDGTDRSSQPLPSAETASEISHREPTSRDDRLLVNVVILIVACLALGGWFIEFRAARRRPKPSEHEEPIAAALRSLDAPGTSRSRYARKRLKILNLLMNDHQKLLPNDMKVSDLMTTAVEVAAPTTTAGELRRLIAEHSFRHVLICNAAGELVGIVSDRDLRNVDDSTPASKLMVEHPTTVQSDSRVNDAITLLIYDRISSLPVVDGGRLVGILTTTDVVMTMQCAMLAVEQMVAELHDDRRHTELTAASR